VVFVTATITDDNGVTVPRANELVSFQVTGPGKVVAVDNADNMSVEPFQADERHAYQGRCEAAVRATEWSGKFAVMASAPGLKAATVEIEIKADK
jgi:beta-galactosidase